jgi:hypothetical protein
MPTVIVLLAHATKGKVYKVGNGNFLNTYAYNPTPKNN